MFLRPTLADASSAVRGAERMVESRLTGAICDRTAHGNLGTILNPKP